MHVAVPKAIEKRFSLWIEGGALFIGSADSNVVAALASGRSSAALRRVARKMIASDPSDRRFPGGVHIVD